MLFGIVTVYLKLFVSFILKLVILTNQFNLHILSYSIVIDFNLVL
jgi:hypothetical protein